MEIGTRHNSCIQLLWEEGFFLFRDGCELFTNTPVSEGLLVLHILGKD